MLLPSQIDLLFVDDSDEFRDVAVMFFERRGFQVRPAPNVDEALRCMQERRFDVVVTDMMMPGLSGVDLLQRIREYSPECETILLTGHGTVESAVQSMKLGAYDYLMKPVPLPELEAVVLKAAEKGKLNQENSRLRGVLQRSQPQWQMVGESAALREVFRLILRAGPSEKPILIQGESGTGKELVARALHDHSPRAGKPLVTVNCTALSETLLESELFGHEKGAFTGAVVSKPGLFELADGGTLFIDEIGEMPVVMQSKLLRVLQDGSMRRVGSLQERRVDVRIISATNRSMQVEVESKRFREDLYYRINVLSLELPPLRNRSEDIPLLVSHFMGPDWEIAKDAMQALVKYQWPGNVRQLINVLERAKILAEDQFITTDELPSIVLHAQTSTPTSPSASSTTAAAPAPDATLAEIEKARVIDAMQQHRGNKSRAAVSLGITRRSLYRLLEKYEFEGGTQQPLPDADETQSTI